MKSQNSAQEEREDMELVTWAAVYPTILVQIVQGGSCHSQEAAPGSPDAVAMNGRLCGVET